MSRPPAILDGAFVLFWAWSGDEPFFVMTDTEGRQAVDICGLAICRYSDSPEFYRFSCDRNWEVQNDSAWGSPEEAMEGESTQYDARRVQWNPSRL